MVDIIQDPLQDLITTIMELPHAAALVSMEALDRIYVLADQVSKDIATYAKGDEGPFPNFTDKAFQVLGQPMTLERQLEMKPDPRNREFYLDEIKLSGEDLARGDWGPKSGAIIVESIKSSALQIKVNMTPQL